MSSLVGSDGDARDARGKPKLRPYSAVCLTVCVENGLVVAALPVPDETQRYAQTIHKALANGPIGANPTKCERLIYQAAALGGPLRKFPKLILTDNVGKDINIWANVAEAYVQGCFDHGVPVMIPVGAARKSAADRHRTLRHAGSAQCGDQLVPSA